MGIITLFCLFPIVLVISGSLSSETAVITKGYNLLPQEFCFTAYAAIFKDASQVLRCYANTVFITLVGTAVGLFFTAMTAYVLQKQDFEWRNSFAFFFYFTTLFSGGLVPSYLLMISLGMRNTYTVLIVPGLFSVFNLLVMRNFMKTIPQTISESAEIDGANDFVIFIYLILPLSGPSLATISLFMALNYWNSWHGCMLYITDASKFTLQYYLYNMLNSTFAIKELLQDSGGYGSLVDLMPAQTTRLAMTVVATGPIVLLYPFIQRFFVKGITVGAVKG